jgi:5-methylcytosine-specific restriction endonuclease McrA
MEYPKPAKKVTLGKLKKRLENLAKNRAKERDGYTCQKCGRKVEKSNAHGSHVIPVSASQALRFDLLNIKCLCFKCHIGWWHKNPLEAADWFKTKFPERWDYLQEHKHDIKQWRRPELEELLRKKNSEKE